MTRTQMIAAATLLAWVLGVIGLIAALVGKLRKDRPLENIGLGLAVTGAGWTTALMSGAFQ